MRSFPKVRSSLRDTISFDPHEIFLTMQGTKNESVIVGTLLVVAMFLAAAPLPGAHTHPLTQKKPESTCVATPCVAMSDERSNSLLECLIGRPPERICSSAFLDMTRGLSPLSSLPPSARSLSHTAILIQRVAALRARRFWTCPHCTNIADGTRTASVPGDATCHAARDSRRMTL